ncbi:hypothetical protein RHECIAT_PC0000977 (plasmid) [Rhizobium etli CIAT 652]|uniref:Uncharacterized protein n=1 Tax=Rhizobium etli (strain CIAT 652) TaxID=491916 RepID=B3Q4E0_RHIE6|nr:hypothetical protein RHECIAT_PC0000977 [Rhizobium etli CIAT 652]
MCSVVTLKTLALSQRWGGLGCSRFANHWQPQQPSSRLSCPCLRARPAQPTRCKPARLDTAASTMDSDLPAGTASATIAPAAIRGNGWSEERRDLSRKSRISGSYQDSVGIQSRRCLPSLGRSYSGKALATGVRHASLAVDTKSDGGGHGKHRESKGNTREDSSRQSRLLRNKNGSGKRHHQHEERLHDTESAILDNVGNPLERRDPQKHADKDN